MLQERRKEVDILRENARLKERNGRYRSIAPLNKDCRLKKKNAQKK